MPAYWINTLTAVRDEGKLAAYVELAGPAMLAGGGRFLARGAPAAVLCEQLEQTVVSWLDGHDHDDVAMLAIQAPPV